MLSENTLNALPEAIYQRLNAINTECLNRIGQKVKEIGQLSRGDSRKLQRIQTYGAEDIERELERITAKNTREIYGIIDAVAKDIYTSAAPLYDAKGLEQIPYAENRNLLRYVESIARQTVGEYINLTQHTAFCIFGADGTTNSFFKANSNKIPTSLSETYTRVIDEAVTAAQTGLTDYYSAMRRTMKALADSGVRTVDYATGYSRRLDTSVRQNVLWGVKQCAQGVSDQVGEELGTDGWEISYHSNPRPSHEDMGGRQYTAGDTGVTISGKYYPPFKGGAESPEALLKDYNCLHYKFPILLGISEPVYDDDELAALKANDKRTIEYEGKTYTGYEATQVQRKLETEIRRQKDRANLAAACGDDDMRREAQEKINQLTRHYANFSKAAGLPTHMERMRVAGFHKVKSTSEIAQKRLTLSGSGSIIKEPNNKNITLITGSAINAVPLVKIPNLTDGQNEVVQNLHRVLLQTSQIKNKSLETAFVISHDLTRHSIDYGTSESLEFITNQAIDMLAKERGLMIMHNHPGNGSFSLNDLMFFASQENVSIMSVVKNNGNVEILVKSMNYSVVDTIKLYNRAIMKYGTTDKAVIKFLGKAAERGYIEWLK